MSFVLFPTKPEHAFIPRKVANWMSGIACTFLAVFLVFAGIALQVSTQALVRAAAAPYLLWALISWIFNPRGLAKLSPTVQWIFFLGLAAAAILS